jgi:hypothetical protein
MTPTLKRRLPGVVSMNEREAVDHLGCAQPAVVPDRALVDVGRAAEADEAALQPEAERLGAGGRRRPL